LGCKKIPFLVRKNRRIGQSILGFVFSFIVVLALAIGITRIWLWFTSNFAQRQDEYQDTRMVAANKDSYGAFNNDTAYLGSSTIDPIAPLDITDDWVFAGRTDQEISFVLQPIGMADAEERCRAAHPECVIEHVGENGIIIYEIREDCYVYDKCMCERNTEAKLAALAGQIDALDDAERAMRSEAAELRRQAEECDDWWELCWWAGFGVTARKLKDSANKIDAEANKLAARKAEIQARYNDINNCCQNPVYTNLDEMNACLDLIAANQCPMLIQGYKDEWDSQIAELGVRISEANNIINGITSGLAGNGCAEYAELRCQKDCAEPAIEPCKAPCYTWAEDRCEDQCDAEAEDWCANTSPMFGGCQGLPPGDPFDNCMALCVPPRSSDCQDDHCDTTMTDWQLENDCGSDWGRFWWYCWNVRECFQCDDAGNNPPCYGYCMWTEEVPPCVENCMTTGAGLDYEEECCESFCCLDNNDGLFYNCELKVMHQTQSYGQYPPWWDSLPGGERAYLHPWVNNNVECGNNPPDLWGRGCVEPTEDCDEGCDIMASDIPLSECINMVEGPLCGLSTLRDRLQQLINDAEDGLIAQQNALEALKLAIDACCEIMPGNGWFDADRDGFNDVATDECFFGETLTDCQQRCIAEIADLIDGDTNIQDECPDCFNADLFEEACLGEEGEILPYCQAECISECVGLVEECQDCCSHYATSDEPEKLECCNILCQEDYPPCPAAIPDPDYENPDWPWGDSNPCPLPLE